MLCQSCLPRSDGAWCLMTGDVDPAFRTTLLSPETATTCHVTHRPTDTSRDTAAWRDVQNNKSTKYQNGLTAATATADGPTTTDSGQASVGARDATGSSTAPHKQQGATRDEALRKNTAQYHQPVTRRLEPAENGSIHVETLESAMGITIMNSQ